MGKFIDLTGRKFGRLTVVSRAENDKHGGSRWLCVCDCGKENTVRYMHLTRGRIVSCGCYQKENSTKHGLSRTPLYGVWSDMKQRCYSVNCSNREHYYDRGIKVCDEWLEKFDNFAEWAFSSGYNPKLRIDRINTNGNYEPSNCRWVTPLQNIMNTRSKKGSMSKYKGLTRIPKTGKWVAKIRINGRSTHIGTYVTEKEAAMAYNDMALKHYGEYAYLNTFDD